MRILHLVCPAIDGDEPLMACGAAVSVRSLDGDGPFDRVEHRVIVLGGHSARSRAAEFGITADAMCGTPLTNPWLSVATLRAAVARLARRVGPFDLAQCWSPACAGAARWSLLGLGTRLLVYAAHGPPQPDDPVGPGSRRITSLDGLTIGTSHVAISREWEDRTGGDIRTLGAPGATPPDPERTARDRATLAGEPTDLVISLLADPPRRADAKRFIFLIGILHCVGRRSVAVVPRGVRGWRRAARFACANGGRWGLVESGLPLHRLAAASDLAVIDGAYCDTRHPEQRTPAAGPNALLACLRAGVPTAVIPHGATRDLLGSLAPECVAPNTTVTGLGRPLTLLGRDDALRARVAARFRARFDPETARQTFQHTMIEFWREAAGMPLRHPWIDSLLKERLAVVA